MQNNTFSFNSCQPNGNSSKTGISVIAIHDGFSSGVRAKEALEWLNHILGMETQIHSIVWKFEQLERLDLRAISIRAAAVADMLIVSASDLKPLPDHIKKWMGSIFSEQLRSHPILVALHDETTGQECTLGPFCQDLKQIARSSQTQFMCNEDFDSLLQRDFTSQLIQRKSQRPLPARLPFGDEFYSTPRRWGING